VDSAEASSRPHRARERERRSAQGARFLDSLLAAARVRNGGAGATSEPPDGLIRPTAASAISYRPITPRPLKRRSRAGPKAHHEGRDTEEQPARAQGTSRIGPAVSIAPSRRAASFTYVVPVTHERATVTVTRLTLWAVTPGTVLV
jgi:hypothetical protein